MRKRTDITELDEARAESLMKEILERADTGNQLRYDELAAYMAPIRRYPALTDHDEFVRLYGEFRNGPTEVLRREARDLIVYRNMRLVLSIAMRFTGRGLPLIDLLQEGAIALTFKALEQFDLTRGYHFSTYASWWIRQAITHAIADTNERIPFRIPVHMQESMNVVRRAMGELLQQLGTVPNELALFEQIRTRDTEKARAMKLSDVARCRRIIVQGYLRSDAPASRDGEGDETIGDLLSDGPAKTETVVEARRMLKQCNAALTRLDTAVQTLPPREAMIIRLRFGLGEFDPMTLEAIAERYELTRERIRQIETVALGRLGEHGVVLSSDEVERLVNVTEELARIVASV